MLRLAYLLTLLVCVYSADAQPDLRDFDNAYTTDFAQAYNNHPEIPKGLLEAVAYNRTNFRFLDEQEMESCTGLPRSFGLFGLIEDGKGYFSNTLELISDLSEIEPEVIRSNPNIHISAYADAIASLNVESWNAENIAQRLMHLSALPRETEEQMFALEIQTFEVLSLLNHRAFMNRLGYEPMHLDLPTVFGDNYSILSAKRILMDGEHIYNESGEMYRAGGGIAPCNNYAADTYIQTPSCNYSSRNGIAVSAVTIHTIQGSYAGAISWAQNCNANVSYHYVVSSTGQITQMLCEADKGWHVGTENPYTIGIEHDGYVTDPNNYTPAMYATTADLCADITQSGYGIEAFRTAYFPWAAETHYNVSGIPGSCIHIKGHQHFPNQTHTDPGEYWDWDYFYKLVNINTPITTLNSPSGTFYDDGGQVGVYSNDVRSLNLIQPSNASSVSVTFQEFDIEDEWDYLYIYDGTDVFSPLIGVYTGTNNPGTVTSSNGHLMFEFRSDCFTTEPGWAATWTSTQPDNTSPTVSINAGPWETENFYTFYSENDNQGGSGVRDEERFSLVTDFDGSRWSGNSDLGYFYDFFSPALSQWQTEVGSWSLNGGTAVQSDESAANTNMHIPVVQEQFSNYLYGFRMKISGSGTNRRAGIHFMCSAPTLENRGDSYFIYLRADNDKVQIYKVVNDVWTLETNDDLTVDADTWYDVKVVCNHLTGEIRVYVDGEMVSEWTDPDPLPTGNSISLRTGNCMAEYDDVRVYKSRIGAQYITVGTMNDPVRYQNPDPNTPSCEIRTIIFDNAGNCSDEVVEQVNVDWTPPVLSGVNDGVSVDIDETNDGTQLSANWAAATDPNSGIDRYEVAIGTTAGNTDVFGWSNEGLSTSVNVPSALTPNEWYYTTVKAFNAAGLEEADTSNGQQYIDITVGIEELMQQSVYPNPTTGIVNLPQVKNLSWQLFDATGRLIQEGVNQQQINLGAMNLPEQVMLLRLVSDESQTTLRISYIKE